MKKKKITQRMLAAHLDLSMTAVNQMLNTNNMNVSRLAQIAEVLDVNVSDLFDDSQIYHVRCPFCGRTHAISIKNIVIEK